MMLFGHLLFFAGLALLRYDEWRNYKIQGLGKGDLASEKRVKANL